MSKRTRMWTQEEKDYLMENAKDMRYKEIGYDLGRKENSVKKMYHKLKKEAQKAEVVEEVKEVKRHPAKYSNPDYTTLIDYYAGINV